MKKVCAFLIVLSILASALPAIASQVQVSKSDVYETAQAYVILFGDYESALELFGQLGSYADSATWKMYCMGMITIQKANELEQQGFIREAKEEITQAVSIFEFLSPVDFNNNSKNLFIYCNARLDEYGSQGISQSALDKYATLVGTEDSMDRYLRLIQGIPLPTQAPYSVTLGSVAAHTEASIDTFLGPGKRYLSQEMIQVNENTRLSICGKEGDYYLIEADTGRGKIRCWALARKIQPDSSANIPRIGTNGWKSTLSQPAQAYYGPGEQYIKADFSISQGTMVTAYDPEGEYTMIECPFQNLGKDGRVWVKTDYLRR